MVSVKHRVHRRNGSFVNSDRIDGAQQSLL